MIFFTACNQTEKNAAEQTKSISQKKLYRLLADKSLPQESKFAAVNQIASSLLLKKDYNALILFLTDYVDKNSHDSYNAYWLLMTAFAYIQNNAAPIAQYYFDRILANYNDLSVDGKSVHLTCLENLITLSTIPDNRIFYYTQLITRFADNINPTPLYFYLAREYENIGEWEKSLRSYTLFVQQPDSVTIQVQGYSDAYATARKLIDFNNSSKDRTFESLQTLSTAIKNAIDNHDWRALDRYKSNVNFFAMSWKQEEMSRNSQEDFSMRNFMDGSRIRYRNEFDESSNPSEAFLRTWGWGGYIPVWYLYFRKVNFPLDPEIHGRWEWAGIYYGDKL